MLDFYTKPKVAQVTGWVKMYESGKVTWHLAENHDAFHRVVMAGKRPRYFYGENAYYDARRLAADADFHAWQGG
jgi:hypothetical protein